jgi:3-deoxy-D-manno-octulosonic acid kinase
MAVAELHEAGKHYLFNTDCVDPDTTLFEQPPSNTVTDQQGRGTVYFKTINSRGQPLSIVIKHYQRGGLVRYFNRQLYLHRHHQHTRVWREFRLLLALKELGLPVPLPLAGLAQMKFPGCYTSAIITQEIKHSATLAEHLQRPQRLSTANTVADTLWHKIGTVLKRFHNASVYHADLNASNILVTDDDDIYLIDFDKGAIKSTPSSTPPTDWRADNLQRLQRSLLKFRNNNDQFNYAEANWRSLMQGYNSETIARTGN